MFCKECGKKISNSAVSCPKCGYAIKKENKPSDITSIILCFFFGMLGIHRFYEGKIGSGFAMLFLTMTIVFCWISAIWTLVDFITRIIDLPKNK